MNEPSHRPTDREILVMRRRLARIWRQTLDQVTEHEARYYLRTGETP